MNRNILIVFLAAVVCIGFGTAGNICISQTTNDLTENTGVQTEFSLSPEAQANEYKLLWTRQSLEKSIELYRQAADQWMQNQRPDKAVFCLREIGDLQVILSSKKDAEDSYKKALEVLRTNDFPIERAQIFSKLSLVYLASGKIDESKKYFEQAVSAAEQTGDESAKATAFQSAGEFYYVPDLLKSVDFYEKSVDSWRRTGDVRGEATALSKLGHVYSDLNRYETALETLNSSLKLWEQLGDSRGQAITLRGIGTVFNVSNEKQKALEYYQKAEILIPKEVDYFEQAVLYNGFGSIYEYFGEWKLSAGFREKALDLFKSDEHSHGQLATLSSLARLNSLMNKDESALDYFQQAESLSVKLKKKFYPGIIKKDLGNFYFNRNDLEKAESNYKESLKFLQAGNDTRQISLIFSKLGELYLRRNDFQTAHKYFTGSLELNRKVKDNFAEAETAYHLAKLADLENRNEEALDWAKNSVELTESLSSNMLNTKLKRTYFSSVYDRYELYIHLLVKNARQFPEKDFHLKALQISEKARARSLTEILNLKENGFVKDASPEIIEREKKLRNTLELKTEHLSELLKTDDTSPEIEQTAGEIESLNMQLEEIQVSLKQKSPVYSAIKTPPLFDLNEFQQNVLDEKTLVLEFSFGKIESYLWIIGKSEFGFYVLPPQTEIERHIENLSSIINSQQLQPNETIDQYQARITQSNADYWLEAHLFSNKIFGQISGKLLDKRLLIVSDGKLRHFPVSALPLPVSDRNEPILLSNEVVYEPSASIISSFSKNKTHSNAAPKDLIVFADPIFSENDPRVNANDSAENNSESKLMSLNIFRSIDSLDALPRLSSSKNEADSISKIVGEAHSTVATGSAANRRLVTGNALSDYKIIHFATHGLLNTERPELSSLILSRFDEKGSNLDGVLRLQDIYGLNVSADLVVLSACSTGIGKEVKGEGLISLNNAFLQIGAKSVVSSIWKVDDYATQELMKNFYRELYSGNTNISESLRQAQIKMWQNPQFQSPIYWAAFTVEGDFKNSVQFSSRSNYKIYLLLFGFILIPILFFIYRRGNYRNPKRLFNRKIVN